MNIIFNILSLALVFIGEWWDYSATMKLERKGWLNTRIDQMGVQVESREANTRYMKNGVFQSGKFKTEKIAVTIFCVVLTAFVLIFLDSAYHPATMIFNMVVGIYHAYLGYKNGRNYKYIAEVTGR